MAVDYGQGAQVPHAKPDYGALLITQFVGFPAALAFGQLGEKLGAKAGILIGLAVYVMVCVFGYRMERVSEFYVLAVVVGLVQGGRAGAEPVVLRATHSQGEGGGVLRLLQYGGQVRRRARPGHHGQRWPSAPATRVWASSGSSRSL